MGHCTAHFETSGEPKHRMGPHMNTLLHRQQARASRVGPGAPASGRQLLMVTHTMRQLGIPERGLLSFQALLGGLNRQSSHSHIASQCAGLFQSLATPWALRHLSSDGNAHRVSVPAERSHAETVEVDVT